MTPQPMPRGVGPEVVVVRDSQVADAAVAGRVRGAPVGGAGHMSDSEHRHVSKASETWRLEIFWTVVRFG